MKRLLMIVSVLALVFAFTAASVSAQNAPKAKTSTQKVVTEKSATAAPAVDKKDAKAGCSHDGEKMGCAKTCSGEKAKSCCSKGTATPSAKPVPAPDNK